MVRQERVLLSRETLGVPTSSCPVPIKRFYEHSLWLASLQSLSGGRNIKSDICSAQPPIAGSKLRQQHSPASAHVHGPQTRTSSDLALHRALAHLKATSRSYQGGQCRLRSGRQDLYILAPAFARLQTSDIEESRTVRVDVFLSCCARLLLLLYFVPTYHSRPTSFAAAAVMGLSCAAAVCTHQRRAELAAAQPTACWFCPPPPRCPAVGVLRSQAYTR